jgi:hypothetical protein
MILGYKCAAIEEATMWTALNKMADIIQLYVDAKRDASGEPKANPESLEDRFLSRFKPQTHDESEHDMPDENAAPDPDASNTPSDQSSDESGADDNHDSRSTSSDELSDSYQSND